MHPRGTVYIYTVVWWQFFCNFIQQHVWTSERRGWDGEAGVGAGGGRSRGQIEEGAAVVGLFSGAL